jgi:hypothetical protein
MLDSVGLFLALGTQWKYVAGGLGPPIRIGLDYAAVEPTARGMGINVTPRIFADLRVMEEEALDVWSKR